MLWDIVLFMSYSFVKLNVQHILKTNVLKFYLQVNENPTLLLKTIVCVEYCRLRQMKSQLLVWNEIQIFI
jgi:hypothetical protein